MSRLNSALTDLANLVLPSASEKPHPPGVSEEGKPFLTGVFEAGQQLVESCDRGVVQCHPFSDKASTFF